MNNENFFVCMSFFWKILVKKFDLFVNTGKSETSATNKNGNSFYSNLKVPRTFTLIPKQNMN